MEIRHATINDLAEVARVEAECFPAAEAASAASFAERLRHYPEHFWMMFDGDELISFVNGMVSDDPDLCDEMFADAAMHNPDGRWQMIFGVNTVPARRRNGHAAKLIEWAIEEARQQKRAGLVLTCKEHMLHYYAKFGFVNEGDSESEHGGAKWYQMRLTF